MPRLIRMTATRRGALGDGRYRVFRKGDTYVESETTGPDDTVSPFLADQFVGADDAVEVDTADAPAKTAATAAETGATVDDPRAPAGDPKTDADDLDEKTVEDLREIAGDLEIEGRSKLTTKDQLVDAIRAKRAESAE